MIRAAMDSSQSFSNCTPGGENDATPKSSVGFSKSLTVTFRHIDVQVNGFGDDFAPTCWSVIEDLIPFRRRKASKRVNENFPNLIFSRV
jgi:hypothetical protein